VKLINKQTGQPVVEFGKETVLFHNKFLEREMRALGILIPHGMRGIYYGKDCIRLGEEGFDKAFKEIYYITMMDPEIFEWTEA